MTHIITPKNTAKPKRRSVSFKVSEALYEELEALKNRVNRHRHEIDFNLDLVMAEALQKHIKVANKHLDRLEQPTAENTHIG